MTIQITPDQVPDFWESIKYASVESDRVEPRYISSYLNHLLHLLLSGRAQCFVNLDNERKLKSICITSINIDDFTGEKSLLIRNIYAFQQITAKEWISDFDHLVKLAEKENCRRIYGWSTNVQVANLSKLFGMKELTRSYGIDI